MPKSLTGRGLPLAGPAVQLAVLDRVPNAKPFGRALADAGLAPLRAGRVDTLQMNVGKLCNQTCRHCHVDAGPDRRELMDRPTMEACVRLVREAGIATVDITGGAPEMNPSFRWLVAELRALGARVMDRCNLTLLRAPGYRDLPDFLATQQVEIVASLPYFLASKTDAQRGDGVFDASIEAIRTLNGLGYGREGTGLVLNLVYNPSGAFLPGRQATLEADFRRELDRRYGVAFNRLFALTNLPISRFLEYLVDAGLVEEYLERLIAAFNPATVDGLMCRGTLSVGWDGRLHDCDFNQMLDLEIGGEGGRTIHDLDPAALEGRPIVTGLHCYGCTAGAGSSCGGSLA